MTKTVVAGHSIETSQRGYGETEIVFVHGIRNAGWVWDHATAHLDPKRFRWTVFDLPGCGESDTPDRWEDCTLQANARLLARLVEQLCDAPPTLVGHSFGGGIVAQTALDNPDLASSIALVAPTPLNGLAAPLDEVLAGAFADRNDVDRLGRAAFVKQPAEADYRRLVSTVLGARPSHTEGALRSAHGLSIRDRLPELSIPAMVLGGDRDRHVPPSETYLTAAALRRPEVQIWTQVGHVPHWEHPEHFTELIADFAIRSRE